MKKFFPILIIALLTVSCGTTGKQSSSDSGDTINIGYGDQAKDGNNYSVSKIKANKNDISKYNNIYDYLEGRVPGVLVMGEKVIIRGVGTNSDETDPLFIVDGIEVPDISSINPDIVEDITVLKDGSSSMYGMQGANGVILITTKK